MMNLDSKKVFLLLKKKQLQKISYHNIDSPFFNFILALIIDVDLVRNFQKRVNWANPKIEPIKFGSLK